MLLVRKICVCLNNMLVGFIRFVNFVTEILLPTPKSYYDIWLQNVVNLFAPPPPFPSSLVWLTLQALKKKIVARTLEGGGEESIGPPPSTFDTIRPIDIKFGTYNKLHLYF